MAIVRLQPPGSAWEQVGKDRLRGLHPQAVNLTATRRGADTARFTLKRDPGSLHPDLGAFTPCEIEVKGKKVWSGRVVETPGQEGDDRQISVEGRGGHYQLDDDVEEKFYVHTLLTDFKDHRALLGANLGVVPTSGFIEVGDGGIIIGWQDNETWNAGYRSAVTLDLGPTNGVKRVVAVMANLTGAADANFFVFFRSHSTQNMDVSGAFSPEDISGMATTEVAMGTDASPTTHSGTSTNPQRYLSIFAYRGATSGVVAERKYRLKSLLVTTHVAYESGGVSVLKASTVVADQNDRLVPLLSTDDSRIAITTFNIPDYAPPGLRTPRENIEAVNAYHHYDYGVDVEQRLYFQPPPTAPVYAVGSWAGADFRDASSGSGEEIYDQVVVEATGPDGEPLRVKRTQTGTIVDRRGFHRTKILPVGSPQNVTSCNQLGDIYLAAHRLTPFKGDLTIHGQGGVRRVLGGSEVHPSELLLGTRELIRFTDKIDPDTGALGRDGVIAAVSYDDDTETAQVSLDSSRDNLEALLQRLAVVVGS